MTHYTYHSFSKLIDTWKKILMKTVINHTTKRFEFRAYVASSYAPLIKLKEEGDRTGFNKLMERVLPSIKQYLSRQLKIAVNKKALPVKKYSVEDFVDELFIEAFENIHEVKEASQLYSWLFKEANEILDDAIVDEDFDNTYFKNIDNYTKVEWDAMEENFSVDGDGDLVMLEELDDNSYPKQDYTLQDVFIEDEEFGFIKRLNEKLSEEEIKKQIDLVLHLLPMSMRTIFELTINQQFDTEEIAQIKNLSIQEVEQILANARHIILTSFVTKYLSQ